ncbi:hypothetical protein FN846DRAFT_1019068 [Sphaerosporella brunnea]|uniref:F-box domain-containing protein n=1 Tax=Sphaerosporella brunnea TaxID=1250544 RepID=A0A5J5F7L6_9PEZI|nr:hypothetical protein FN846DRAFT_1019068 [Sphaerosporella brunnea]
MSLNDLPAELLLNILSHLDNLDPLSSANRTLSITVASYQASQLRGRLSRIQRDLELLVTIWPPPTFFHQPRQHRQQPTIRTRSELTQVLCDPRMIPRAEAYIHDLETKSQTAAQVAQQILSLNLITTTNPEFLRTIVLQLWSAQQRYAHDVDGYVASLHERWCFGDLLVRDRYLAALPEDVKRGMDLVYEAVGRFLRPPFGRRGPGGEGMALQRIIARGGMQDVLAMLQQRGGGGR